MYIGRLGLTDRAGRRLLLDWRSPAAEPFFGATHANPMGLASRRRYRWTRGRISDYWDEVFTAEGFEGHAALDDQSAFIASLGTDRTDRMRDVLATIAADQDAVAVDHDVAHGGPVHAAGRFDRQHPEVVDQLAGRGEPVVRLLGQGAGDDRLGVSNGQLVRIDGGMHDLTLSGAAVRARVFDEMERWMDAYIERPLRIVVRGARNRILGQRTGPLLAGADHEAAQRVLRSPPEASPRPR